MNAQSRPGKRWRRFNRKYGPTFLLAFAVLFIIGLVALLMWILTDMKFRPRP